MLTESRECACQECRMPLTSWGEFHPLEACLLYALHKDEVTVRRELGIPAVTAEQHRGGAAR